MNAKNRKLLFLFAALSMSLLAKSQKPFFYEMINVGQPAISGQMVFNPQKQIYEITGSGINMWLNKEQFFFSSRKVTSDFILTAKIKISAATGDARRKTGLMIRQSTDTGSSYAQIVLRSDGCLLLEYRDKLGGIIKELKFDEISAQYLQLEKKGSKILARIARNENELTSAKEIELQFQSPFWVGLAVCSHNSKNRNTGIFSNVRFDVTAAEDVEGEKTQASSRLEILDIKTGNRKIINSTTSHIEAPNWSRDGKFLIYNSEGKLYKFDLAKGTPEVINTGAAIQNNCNHGISFDGKVLAISNHTEENGQQNSIIYTVPLNGGEAFRITEKGPSYWHGWSPDGKYLVYCAERNGDYDVYQIPSNGGVEKQLTTTTGLDDGPEYSPDGKFIYFNSMRTGTMQIWRMNPDGTNQEQITFDLKNDWFAHPSPDGKSLIYISYPSDVPAINNPDNQRVMLRMQRINGKESKVMAHIYGGQGTLNVPAWSPDSKKVAFVSYTYGDLE